jgi:lysyl-tRNA synthetase class 2
VRIRIIEEIRKFMGARGFVEVETPMMQSLAGGAAAKPFVTHHNALDIPLFLRIAPELFLKRLLVGGFGKVFELNRNFRNEGISPRHNPEFTMLEVYEAYGSWETMADLIEDLITTVAQNVFGTLQITHANGRMINLQRPWRRVRMTELVEQKIGWRFEKHLLQESPDALQRYLDLIYEQYSQKMDDVGAKAGAPSGRPYEAAGKWRDFHEGQIKKLTDPAEQLVNVYEVAIEPELIDPSFVTHVPSVIIPLARENKADPYFADVYELAINGVEISPGYSELNDPDIQAKHFAYQVGDKEEQQKVDEDFLTALKYGMPPAGGLGMGIDRLVMMLTGAQSIRDIILFPLLKPLEKA